MTDAFKHQLAILEEETGKVYPQIDINRPANASIEISPDGARIWVHIDDLCVLHIYEPKHFTLTMKEVKIR